MKFKYLMSGALLASAIGFTSCDDKLDQMQHGVDSIESYYKTDSDAEEALNAVYHATLCQYGLQYAVKMALADDAWTGGGGHGDGLYQLGDLVYDEAETNITDLYKYLYKTVYAANILLQNIDEDTNAKKKARAEAKVLRANAYFDLVTLWGTPPLILEPLEAGNYQQPNSTTAEIWAQIETDLNEAISSGMLHEKAGLIEANGSYRVTKQFAQALLGKSYLFQKKYSEAASMLDNVINSGKYGLYAMPGSGEELENLCQVEGENNRESIFEINWYHDVTNANPYSAPMATWAWQVFLGWRTSDRINAGGLPAAWDIHTASWGRWNPRKDLYDAFVSLEGENGYRLRATLVTLQELFDNGADYKDDLNDNEGYYQWKYRFQSKWALSLGFWGSNNFRVMRLGEVYLLAAEAYIQSGNPQKGADYINKIRERARVATKAAGTMEELKLEKRLEMAYDATRFQDLQRWGLQEALGSWKGKQYPTVKAEHDANGKPVFNPANIYWTKTAGSYSAKVDLLPFPQGEMNTNPNCEQQAAWK